MICQLLATVAALQIADVASTVYAIRSSLGRERNPIMARVIGKLGLPLGLLLPKAILMLILYLFSTTYASVAVYVLAALATLYTAVVLNNTRVILKARCT